ncbi:nucleoside phosphorylase domain-containing protein [Aspergillus multicolor]|uniref:nucleoside phosphorylase domain-containing protein n=1 Tax=Aspergillus multicolor TaxID=41759 RepID=UPI003CCDF6F9
MATRNDYRIGWICALAVEMAAARAMLDEEFHPRLTNRKGDRNTYVQGKIGLHNIVITCLPAGVHGTTPATSTVLQMRDSYESLEVCFMVGIGGGAPTERDIRLGDVVVSLPEAKYGGVLQYDRGKALDGGFMPMGALDKPPDMVLRALSALQSQHMLHADQLFVAEYSHVPSETTCHKCDPSKLRKRPPRADDHPRIFYGLIASGNMVIKDAKFRNQLAKQHGILCFEMEAAGIMDIFPCLVIRGICDYADSHKNKDWQGHAAVVAAAYTKELLLHLPDHKMMDRPFTIAYSDAAAD